jgi:hypothetical protein
MLRFSRFRNPIRDWETDEQRISSVRSAIQAALADLTSESVGLSRRVEETRGRVGSIMGSEDGSLFEREPEDERDLQKAERELLSGIERLAVLQRQRICLEEMETQLAKFPINAR